MKSNSKRILLSLMTLGLLLILTGCVELDANKVPTGEGPVYQFFVAPAGSLIQYFANNQGLGFGLGIIVVTILIRILLLPLMLYQSWKASYQSEKMNHLRPYLAPFQDRMKTASTQEEKLAAQTDFMAAQKHYGLNPLGGIGCLPILIQMPFFSALFYASQYTPGIESASFLWFKLGEPNLPLTLVIGVLYYIQSLLMMVGIPEEQKEQMKMMTYTMPIAMVIMSFGMKAGVSLYWFVGGIFAIIQQLLVTYVLKPQMRQQIAAEFDKNPPKAFKPSTSPIRKDVTPQAVQALPSKKSKRNAGKQRKN